MDNESAVRSVATVSHFLAACDRYGHNSLDQLSSLKAPQHSRTTASTHTFLVSVQQQSLNYIKAVITSLLFASPLSAGGNFDIVDVVRASVYLQLRWPGHYLQLLHMFDLTKHSPKKWAEVHMWHTFILTPCKMRI